MENLIRIAEHTSHDDLNKIEESSLHTAARLAALEIDRTINRIVFSDSETFRLRIAEIIFRHIRNQNEL